MIALGQLIIALSIAGWYFTKDKSTAGNGMVLWVSFQLRFFHLTIKLSMFSNFAGHSNRLVLSYWNGRIWSTDSCHRENDKSISNKPHLGEMVG